jgi:hypothetical protein
MPVAILPSQWAELSWLCDKSHQYTNWLVYSRCAREFLGDKFDVVRSVEEAYDLVGVLPEDFTEHLFPKKLAA